VAADHQGIEALRIIETLIGVLVEGDKMITEARFEGYVEGFRNGFIIAWNNKPEIHCEGWSDEDLNEAGVVAFQAGKQSGIRQAHQMYVDAVQDMVDAVERG
jgi:hypothetical protein